MYIDSPREAFRAICLRLLFCIFAFQPLTAAGSPNNPMQEYATVAGYLSDATSGETLIGANIIIINSSIGASTNTSGYYIINRIDPGEYRIRFSYISYTSKEISLRLSAGENLRLDVALVPSAVVLDELVVEANEFEEELTRISATQITVQYIRQMPSIFQADVFRSLQTLPGIKAASDFSSGLYIRGGGPDQTLILLDRTTVYNPSHFFGFFSTFNPDAIKDVRLYKGGYPAEYGGRLGSVVDIYNKDGNRNRTQGIVSLGMLSSRASIEGPYKYGSYMLAARRSTLEPVLAILKNMEDDVPESFYFYDVNGKINFDAGAKDRLSLSFYAGNDNLTFPIGDFFKLKLEYGNRTGSANYTRIISRSMFANVTVTGSNYFNTPYFYIGGTDIERNNRIYDYSVRTDIDWIPGGGHSLKMGLWAGNLLLRLDDWFDNENVLSYRIETSYASAFIQNKWQAMQRLSVTTGLRANYFTQGEFIRVEPRASAIYDLTHNMTVQGVYGRYYQFLSLLSMESFAGFDLWLPSDKGVPPAWGDQYGFGVTYKQSEGLKIEIEGYYRTMKGLFELDPFLPDPAGLEYAELLRFGEGNAYGIEILVERSVGKLNGFIGYAWGRTNRRFPGFNRDNFYPPKFDRTHDLDLVVNYHLSEKWFVTGVFNYATGQAYTEPLGRAFIFENPFAAGNLTFLVVGNVNASRLPSYHRFDVSLSRRGGFFGIAESELQFQIINLYSRRNIWFYSYDYNDDPISRTDVRLLPIIPSINYTVYF